METATMSTWAAIALSTFFSTITLAGLGALAFSKLTSRLTAIETWIKLFDESSKDRRSVEMTEHCDKCAVMKEHRQFGETSSVRPSPLAGGVLSL